MAVQMRIAGQSNVADQLAQLLELAQIIKDPKAIEAAQEIARKEIALTSVEQQKADEARDFINRYPALLQELTTKEQALESTKQEQGRKFISEEAIIAARREVLEAREAEVSRKTAINEEALRTQASETKKLELYKKEIETAQKQTQRILDERDTYLQTREAELLNLKAQLAEKEKELEDKHEALKSILAR